MANRRRDTTKRTRDKTLIYWIFGLIAVAIGLLLIGRVSSDQLRENNANNNDNIIKEIKIDNISTSESDLNEITIEETIDTSDVTTIE